MSRLLIYKFFLFLLMSFGTAFSTQALECHLNTPYGATEEVEDIGQLKIPALLPVGSRLWTSKPMSRTVSCWAYEQMSSGEWVYFYPNPDNTLFAAGIGMGVIYNGQDLGILNTRAQTNMYRYPRNRVEPPETGVVNYQVYLQKIGPINTVGANQVSVFQLDGILGINSIRGQNYRFTLTGLNKIEVMQCSASVELEAPEGVNFGQVRSWRAGEGTVTSKDFTVFIRKNGCQDNFRLEVNFMAKDGTLVDTTGLDMANGSTLRIYDKTNPKWIKFNQLNDFADMTNKTVVVKSYTASLQATENAQEGLFKKTIVLLVNYL